MIVLWLVAFDLGYIGFADRCMAIDEERSLTDIFYLVLQLFILESGPVYGSVGWQLEVARLLAPAVTTLAVFQGLATLFAEQLRRARLRTCRDHAIVCGLGRKGTHLAESLCAAGHTVVIVEAGPEDAGLARLREMGALVLKADATGEHTLRTAGVGRAKYLFVVCGSDGANAEIVARARSLSLARSTGALTCVANIVDVELCRLLTERAVAEGGTAGIRIEFFNVFDSGARRMMAAYPPFDGEHSHIAVMGSGGLADSAIVEAAWMWRELRRDADSRARVTLLADGAEAQATSLVARHPFLRDVLDIEARPLRVTAFGPQTALDGSGAVSAYICGEDEAANLALALALRRGYSQGTCFRRIVVRMDEQAGLASLLPGEENLPEEPGAIRVFALLEETCKVDLLTGGIHEVLARAMHEDYLMQEQARGHVLRSRRAMHPWADLDEDLREANRYQVQHLAQRLRALGYHIVPLTDWDAQDFEFAPDEVETMARTEHERWCAERMRAGYVCGPARDDSRKTHPDLVPWDALAEESRDKDRAMVHGLPAFLARARLQVSPRPQGTREQHL